MANFKPAYDAMIRNEGGYINHKVKGDRGGQTYAGIARAFHGDWIGWHFVDRNDMENPRLKKLVFVFYHNKFWKKIKGDDIVSQRIAESVFDFSVNAGFRTGIKLVQLVVGVTPDGILGKKTLAKLNQADEEVFISKYTIAKIARYTEIVKRDRSQMKFLVGWLNRTLRGIV